MRFLIPTLPLLAVAGALSFESAIARLPSARARTAGAVAVVAVMAAALAWTARPVFTQAETTARSLTSPRAAPVPPAFEFVNTQTPPDATVMLLNTNQGFFLERRYIADSFFEASQMGALISAATSEDDLERRLRELGVTHVLFWRKDWGIRYPPVLRVFLADPARARLVYESPERDYVLYALTDLSGPNIGAPVHPPSHAQRPI